MCPAALFNYFMQPMSIAAIFDTPPPPSGKEYGGRGTHKICLLTVGNKRDFRQLVVGKYRKIC